MDLAIARVARFYSFSHNEIMTMPIGEFDNYLECMEKIISIEMLESITVSSFPHMSNSGRDKVDRQLKGKLSDLQEKRPMSLRQLAAATGRGIK